MPKIVSERADVLPALAEVFREHGFAGASLSLISEATGLGKGSLYHFFPGGKAEMAEVVLEEISRWFEDNMFLPLREDPDPRAAIREMFRASESYFRSGRRVCLVGVFALGDVRDQFAEAINAYFVAWRDSLATALRRAGKDDGAARDLAEEIVAAIQGALVFARALNDPRSFSRSLNRLEMRLALAFL